MNSTRITRWIVYLLITVAVVAILWSYTSSGPEEEELAVSTLAQQIKQGDVAELEVSSDGREVTVKYQNENRPPAKTQISDVTSLEELLIAYGITERQLSDGEAVIKYEPPSKW